MIIKNVSLRNFMSHKDTQIHFNKGLNLILGGNGAGKSAIINAIAVGLFDYAELPLNRLVMSGERTAVVQIEFSIGTDLFLIQRSFGHTSMCRLTKNDEVVTELVRDTYSYLSQLFETPSASLFRSSLLLKSSSLVAPFILEPSKRKIIFDDLLGIEEYNKVWDRLREPIADLAREIDGLERQLDTIKAFIEDMPDLSTINAELKKGEEYLSRLDEKLVQEREKYVKHRAKIESLKKQIEAHESHKRAIKHEIEQLTKRSDRNLQEIDDINNSVILINERRLCPVCHQPLNEVIDVRSQYEQKKEERWSEQNKIAEALDSLIEGLKQIPTIEGLKLQLKELEDKEAYYIFSDVQNERERTIKDIAKYQQLQVEAQKKLDKTVEYQKLFQYQSNLKRKHTKLVKIREGIRKVIPLLNETATNEISSTASRFLSNLMGRTAQIIWNNDYSVQVILDQERSFEQLSEGQKVMTALSLRLALNQYSTNLGVLFLDEPTINLDPQSRELLSENLWKLNFKQMFVITHDNTFENFSDNVIKVVNDGTSRVEL